MKKILSLIIAVCMSVGICVSVSAATLNFNAQKSGVNECSLVDDEKMDLNSLDNGIEDNQYTVSYTVTDLTLHEYLKEKSNITGESYISMLLREGVNGISEYSSNSRVYKRYSAVFSYRNNTDYKAELVGLFTLEGSGNYYDIVSVTVGSNLASGSSYRTWSQTAATTRSLSASSANIYAEGKFTVSGGASLNLPGFSFTGSNYWTSQTHQMSSGTITVDMLKYCGSW